MATKKITLTELRHLVKEIIKEYDVNKIDRDYSKLPDDRKKNIKDFLTKRQMEQGYVLQSTQDQSKYYLTRNSITGMHPIKLSNYDLETDVFKYTSDIIEILKTDSSMSREEIFKKYKIRPEGLIDLSKKPYNLKDKIGCYFSIYMPNLMDEKGKDADFLMKIYGTLDKKNDKYNPPFKLKITNIDIDGGGRGKIIPSDIKCRNYLFNKINELIIKNYKFSNNNNIFIDEVIIDRNSIYK